MIFGRGKVDDMKEIIHARCSKTMVRYGAGGCRKVGTLCSCFPSRSESTNVRTVLTGGCGRLSKIFVCPVKKMADF